MNKLAIIVLAAGDSTRMKSEKSKLMHTVCGQPLIRYIIDLVKLIQHDRCIMILGHQAEEIERVINDSSIEIVLQRERRGTGHAVLLTRELLQDFEGDVLIINGDAPLLTKATIMKLIANHHEHKADITFLTALLHDPSSYGRVVKNNHGIPIKIIEEKDCTAAEKLINEVNAGVYCITSRHLFSLLDELKPDNKQHEYYLTDCIAYGINKGLTVLTEQVDDEQEILGVNNRIDLAVIYNIIRRRILDRFMLEGVTIIDPKVTYIDTTAEIKPDTIIHPYTFIEGYCHIGAHCSIGPFSRIIESEIGDHVTIKSHCLLDQAQIKDKTVLDPFMHIKA